MDNSFAAGIGKRQNGYVRDVTILAFHDGSAADVQAVVEHYSTVLSLNLTTQQKSDLAQYLKSL